MKQDPTREDSGTHQGIPQIGDPKETLVHYDLDHMKTLKRGPRFPTLKNT